MPMLPYVFFVGEFLLKNEWNFLSKTPFHFSLQSRYFPSGTVFPPILLYIFTSRNRFSVPLSNIVTLASGLNLYDFLNTNRVLSTTFLLTFCIWSSFSLSSFLRFAESELYYVGLYYKCVKVHHPLNFVVIFLNSTMMMVVLMVFKLYLTLHSLMRYVLRLAIKQCFFLCFVLCFQFRNIYSIRIVT